MTASQIRTVKLWGGPLDGFVYGLEEVDGKLPNTITLAVPSSTQVDWDLDSPLPTDAKPTIAEYRRTHTHPSHGLLPVYRLA